MDTCIPCSHIEPTLNTPFAALPLVAAVKALWHDEGHPLIPDGGMRAYLYRGDLRYSTPHLTDSAHWQDDRRVLLAMQKMIPGFKPSSPVWVKKHGTKIQIRYCKLPVAI